MKITKFLFIIALITTTYDVFAESERVSIENTLSNYMEGSSFNNPSQIKKAFYKNANLYLEKKDTPLWTVPIGEYTSWFEQKNEGKFNGRIGEVLSVDVEGNIATAKVEILIPEKGTRFVDLFLLKKIEGQWLIISKSAVKSDSINHGKRILFIMSNAHFHGDTKLPAGVSFGEIVKAFEAFKRAGYTVDFMSPKGGAIPLAYVNTSVPVHKKYLYNQDFMYAIEHTKTPEEINPSAYRAVHYIGGTNAMYGVAENKKIQEITMAIYEEHNGIISSVCHGTAGIVNLRTKDGEYLVNNRHISGYPESFENQSKAYFKEFPFLIQQTIEDRGGKFFHSKRNTPHVEVDGRIVTGQNHLSSQPVAEKVIALLEKQ